jgi:hypothetical protein
MRRPEVPETVKRSKPKMLVLLLTWAITGTVAITGTGTATGSNLVDTEVDPGLKGVSEPLCMGISPCGLNWSFIEPLVV